MNKLSVVIPAYNEEENIPHTVERVRAVLHEADIDHELIFVDDGSLDGTWDEIRRMCEESRGVRGVRLSRNYGKDPAIFAGLAQARGCCVAVMDCDLQHPPEVLVQMYRLREEGYQVVAGVKRDGERHALPYRMVARTFNRMLSRAVGADMNGASDFILLDRVACDALLSWRERDAFFRVLAATIGFRRTQVPFAVGKRFAGRSKWSVLSLLRYAVRGIAAFSGAPLYLSVIGCALFFALGFGCALYSLLAGQIPGAVFGCLCLFGIGWILGSLGVLGAYVSKLWRQCANRPQYLICEACGDTDEEAL